MWFKYHPSTYQVTWEAPLPPQRSGHQQESTVWTLMVRQHSHFHPGSHCSIAAHTLTINLPHHIPRSHVSVEVCGDVKGLHEGPFSVLLHFPTSASTPLVTNGTAAFALEARRLALQLDLWAKSGASHVSFCVSGWHLSHLSSPKEALSKTSQGHTPLGTCASFPLLLHIQSTPWLNFPELYIVSLTRILNEVVCTKENTPHDLYSHLLINTSLNKTFLI